MLNICIIDNCVSSKIEFTNKIKELNLLVNIYYGDQQAQEECLIDNNIDVLFINLDNSIVTPKDIKRFKVSNLNLEIILMSKDCYYAVEAFDYEATDFLLLPVTGTRLNQSLNKVSIKINKTNNLDIMIKCLGGFDIFINGSLVEFKASKAKEVLAFLIMNKGKSFGWMAIADAVWPDCRDDKRLMNNFHVACYHLRNFLQENNITQIFEYSRNSYRVNIEEFDCDYYNLLECYNEQRFAHRQGVPYNNSYISNISGGELFENYNYLWSYATADKVKRMKEEIKGSKIAI